MQVGYRGLRLAFLAILLAWVAEAWREYSDVDLRVAERRAIPHYIRHGYEYADIDIKKIMQERGLLPWRNNNQPRPQVQQYTNTNKWKHASPPAYNKSQQWKARNSKTMAQSNFIVPWQDVYVTKKSKFVSNFLDGKAKMKHWF